MKKKKALYFSIDRLGDYLIRSNVIKKISENFDENEIICSNINNKLIKNQLFFDKTSVFDLKKKFLNKLIFLKKYLLKEYDTVIALDGKSISFILLFFIKARNKFTFIYRKKGFIKKSLFILNKSLLKIFKIKYVIMNSRDIIESGCNDNYPLKYQNLYKYFNIKNSDVYYLEKSPKNLFSEIQNKYITIHLDEKFNDIQNIETDLNFSIKNLKNFIDKKIFLTSYNNKFDYYKNLKLLKINYKSINFNILSESDVLIIENIPIHDFQSMLENSFFNISSHSGYFVHTSLALNKNTIDLINENDLPWISSWVYKPKNYKVLLKSTNNGSKNICDIFDELKNEIKS